MPRKAFAMPLEEFCAGGMWSLLHFDLDRQQMIDHAAQNASRTRLKAGQDGRHR